VIPVSSGRELLESAARYALAGAGLITPQLLTCATPCSGWDLAALLNHLSDSIEVLREAIATGTAGTPAGAAALPDPRPGCDPVPRLRGQAERLLAACAAVPPGRPVAVDDRELTAGIVAVTGALEIAVHGWDIWATSGAVRPVPPGLAAALLPAAAVLVSPATRPGLFAEPVRLPGPASPAEQLIAFLGRQPRPHADRG
jgi:uncharacterized protein (TIGR03086 family)